MRLAEREFWRQVLREPLLHFLLAGVALWLLAAHHRREADQYRIVVTPERVAEIKAAYRTEFGAPPAPAMMPTLIDNYVSNEVLYREGLARGLDKDDEIVRRRVIQKEAFLEQDTAIPAEPGEAQLRPWFARHRAQYAEPGRVTFSHVFFQARPGHEDAVRRRAQAVLAKLSPATERAPDLGDSFPDLYDFTGFGPQEAQRLFGNSAMARALFTVPVGCWAGPFRSGFGWHLVRVSAREPKRLKSFAEVRDEVKADYMAEARKAANRKRLAALRARYTVVRDDK